MSFFNFKMENIMNILQKVRTPGNRPDDVVIYDNKKADQMICFLLL